MIIEGLPTFTLGIATFFLLPNDPQSAYFLHDNEMLMMVVRHAREYGNTTSAQEFSRHAPHKAFVDWKVWLFCAGQFGADNMLYGKRTWGTTLAFLDPICHAMSCMVRSSWLTQEPAPLGFSTFLPTIITGLGSWTPAQVQLLTIPCYFLGAVTYMLIAYLSDHMQRRGVFAVVFGAISVVGYGILISDSAAGVHYFG